MTSVPTRVAGDQAAGYRQVDVLPFPVVELDDLVADRHRVAGRFQVQSHGAIGVGLECQAVTDSLEFGECRPGGPQLFLGDINTRRLADLVGQARPQLLDPRDSFAAKLDLVGIDRRGIPGGLLSHDRSHPGPRRR